MTQQAEKIKHEWFKHPVLKWETCRKCGIVRPGGNRSGACRGFVMVGLRKSMPKPQEGK